MTIQIVLSLLWLSAVTPCGQVKEGPAPTEAQITALTSAIVDEIYVYDLAKEYADIGVSESNDIQKVTIFIMPKTSNNVIQVIYPLMPLGEIIRMFFLSERLASPHLTPDSNFPPTQPSFRTVYMDNDELCRLKQTWIRRTISIKLTPTKVDIDAARKWAFLEGFERGRRGN